MEAPPLPLVDRAAGLALRRWLPADAGALAAAWADGAIAGRERVDEGEAPEVAARWIRGWDARLGADLSVDLVVGPVDGDEVWGEVGLVRLRLRAETSGPAGPDVPARSSRSDRGGGGGREERTVWELGWWLVPERRGRGLAAPAVRLLLGWMDEVGPGMPVVARIRPDNAASERVATRVGLVRQGPFDDEHDLWVRPRRRLLPRVPTGEV